MKEFKINEYITLRLEKDETNIYVDNVKFLTCKYLLINIPIEQIEYFEEIQSIDEASDTLGKSLEPTVGFDGTFHRKNEIPPEIEFWGHCSNLQVWYENNYDTRLLHSNLAFPLLKKLTEVGDPLAKTIFQEEICKRFESFYPTTIKYLLAGKFLHFLTEEQKNSLLEAWITKDIENVFVFLIGNKFISQFGEQYRPIILEQFNRHIKIREEAYLERELVILFEELGISSQEQFILRLISDDYLLKDIFKIRQYPVPKGDELGINYTHLNVLKELCRFLAVLSEEDVVFKTVIVNQVRELFESQSIGILFSLLRYSFYKLLSLEDFESMISQEDSPFLKNLFDYLGNDKMMEYFDSSLVPCDFLYQYLNKELRTLIAESIKQLTDYRQSQVIIGLSKRINHRSCNESIKKFLSIIGKS